MQHVPPQGDLDGGSQAGREEVLAVGQRQGVTTDTNMQTASAPDPTSYAGTHRRQNFVPRQHVVRAGGCQHHRVVRLVVRVVVACRSHA